MRTTTGESPLEREIDRLYGLPLEHFTQARNELAQRLRTSKERESAELIGGLRKPSISAWAINQLARRRADDVEALLAAGEELKAAQLEGGAAALRETGGRQRELVRALSRAALGLLEHGDRKPSPATSERIAATLRAASVEHEGRQLLRSGRLTDDVESTGFEALAGMAAARKQLPSKASEDVRASERERARELRAEIKRLRSEVRFRERRAAAAEREAAQAERAAREGRELAERERSSLEETTRRLSEAEEALPS